jgi:hypothetical protein
MSLISRAIHGVDDVRAFLSNKTSSTKLRLMQFFGIDMLVAGTSKFIHSLAKSGLAVRYSEVHHNRNPSTNAVVSEQLKDLHKSQMQPS